MEPVPKELVPVLRPVLPALAEEMIGAIGTEVPEYARPLEGRFGRNLRIGVERALSRFLDELDHPGEPDPGAREIYVGLGRGEFREGRSLDALLGAYRVGARVSWRRLVDAGVAAGVEAEAMYALGEAIFAYIDGISAESVEGYAEAQSAAAGERQRLRESFVRMLVREPVPDAATLAAAAAEAGVPLPRSVAFVAGAQVVARRLERALGAEAMPGGGEDPVLVLVADPDAPGRQDLLARTADGHAAALGPTVTLLDAPRSARRSLVALRLGREGLVVADEHLPALLLSSDPELTADLATRALAPLATLTAGRRAPLLATLRAWLEHSGSTEGVARALSVHPQTVRYRLRRLRELFGDSLDSADGRFELQLALRAGPLARRDSHRL